MSADFYDLLEVPEDASQDAIRDAFREKVQVYHPDHNDDHRASAQFTALKKAYDTLGDPVERNAYDRMGHVDYVNKRLDGLPNPDTWAPSGIEDESAGTTSGSTGASSRSTGSAGGSAGRSSGSSGRTSGSTGRSSTGSSGRSSSSRSSSSRSSSGRSSTSTRSGSASGTSSRSGSRSTSGQSGQRAASDGAGAATTGHVDYEIDPVVEWIAEHDHVRRVVGWELLWVVLAVYALALATFVRTSQAAVVSLVDRLVAAGADVGALSTALEREGFPVVADAVVAPLVGGSAGTLALVSGVLLLLGSLSLPAATGLLVYVTRTTPGWKPTWGYVAATLAPLVGVLAGLVATPPLAVELALFAVLPVGGLFVMVLSAFVRPRVLIFLHNVRS